MRNIIVIFLLSSIAANSQDCETLNNFTSFHGVKFGQRFPDSLQKYFVRDTTDDKYIEFSMPVWYTQNNYYAKFTSWFTLGDSLSELYFLCNSKLEVAQITLKQKFEGRPNFTVSSGKYPPFFQNIIGELILLFGTPSVADEKLVEDEATGYSYIWSCSKMNVLALYTFSSNRAIVVINLYDYDIAKKHTVDKYKF